MNAAMPRAAPAHAHIALFGGTFDPPHVGHQIVAEAALSALDVDAVWWMPNATPPHKTASGGATVAQRLSMTHLAAQGNHGFSVTDIETRRGGASYTVDTLRALADAHPDTVFTLLIGADSWRSFERWREPSAILALARLAVYPRGAEPLPPVPPEHGDRVRLLDAPRIGVSSTHIRERIRADLSIRYLVPEAVRAYLVRERLYR